MLDHTFSVTRETKPADQETHNCLLSSVFGSMSELSNKQAETGKSSNAAKIYDASNNSNAATIYDASKNANTTKTSDTSKANEVAKVSDTTKDAKTLPPVDGKVGDITGVGITDKWGVTSTDLGVSILAPNGKLISVFGDTFSGDRVGVGDWRSPVALIGTGDANHKNPI